MLAKGFAVNGAAIILIDIDEKSLFGTKHEAEEASKTIGVEASITTFVILGQVGVFETAYHPQDMW